MLYTNKDLKKLIIPLVFEQLLALLLGLADTLMIANVSEAAVSIGSMWIFRLGCSYLLGIFFGWGLPGVWTVMVIDWISRSIFFVIRFKSGKWEKGEKMTGRQTGEQI